MAVIYKKSPKFQSLRLILSLSLIYLYFPRKCSDEPHPQVPLVQTFRAKTRHAIYIMGEPSSCPASLIAKKEVPFEQHLPKYLYIVEQTLEKMALTSSNQLFSILHILIIYIIYVHKATSFINIEHYFMTCIGRKIDFLLNSSTYIYILPLSLLLFQK